MKYPYKMSKVVNSRLILLEVHVSYAGEGRNYHTNCRLIFETFIRYYPFCVD